MSEPVYPGTDVLINKLGITNQPGLERVERRLVTQQFRSLPDIEVSSNGLRDVHRHLFKDVYPWAGEFRSDEIWKVNPDLSTTGFAPAETIQQHADDLFEHLNSQQQPASADQFAERAATATGALNRIHPFREGNGRTMRAFLSDWSRQQGHEVNFNSWSKDQWMDSSIAAYNGDHSIMRDTIKQDLEQQRDRDLGHDR